MSTPMSESQIKESLRELDGWRIEGDKLTKDFKFPGFREALAFMVRVGFEAEEQVHHPEIFNVYNNVTIGLATHDAGNKVTAKDVKLAKAIDTLL
ncbi:MAG: 4a-hydroxytetrahydrobiopterin dehydratase [Balneolaceae bacterium]|jgi:4a-hydroxytetrahydrobiopterin dehydratase|nr:MAG: 4a-hydroxytetrahydrobiopterin dehydratase [Balneolaceae bacterium]